MSSPATPPRPARDELIPRLRQVYDDVHARVRAAVGGELTQPDRHDGDPAALRVAAAAVSFASDLVAASPARTEWACGKGCHWCCHQPVAVSAPEAIAIAVILRESFPSEWLAQLRAILAQRVAVHDAGGAPAARLPCAFLAGDGSCGIHDWRPLMCRGYNAHELAACQDWYAQRRTALPLDRYSHAMGVAVLHGMVDGCRDAGREHRVYLLHHAVLRALDHADPAAAWARGEEVFAGCARAGTGELEAAPGGTAVQGPGSGVQGPGAAAGPHPQPPPAP